MENRIEIRYCTRCHWLLRAAWMGQELLSTFEGNISALTLLPDETGGVFEVSVNGERVWSRHDRGGFPDIATLKRIVRDRIAPEKDLGHAERTR